MVCSNCGMPGRNARGCSCLGGGSHMCQGCSRCQSGRSDSFGTNRPPSPPQFHGINRVPSPPRFNDLAFRDSFAFPGGHPAFTPPVSAAEPRSRRPPSCSNCGALHHNCSGCSCLGGHSHKCQGCERCRRTPSPVRSPAVQPTLPSRVVRQPIPEPEPTFLRSKSCSNCGALHHNCAGCSCLGGNSHKCQGCQKCLRSPTPPPSKPAPLPSNTTRNPPTPDSTSNRTMSCSNCGAPGHNSRGCSCFGGNSHQCRGCASCRRTTASSSSSTKGATTGGSHRSRLLDQMSSDAKEVKESQKCGNCGAPGHNRRGCSCEGGKSHQCQGCSSCRDSRTKSGTNSTTTSKWSCSECTLLNPSGRTECDACGTSRTVSEAKHKELEKAERAEAAKKEEQRQEQDRRAQRTDEAGRNDQAVRGQVSSKEMRIGNRASDYVRERGGDTSTTDGAHKLDCQTAALIWNTTVSLNGGDLPEEDFKAWREAVNQDLNFRRKTIAGNQDKQQGDPRGEMDFAKYVAEGIEFKFTTYHDKKLEQYINVYENWERNGCVRNHGEGSPGQVRVPPEIFKTFKETIDALKALGWSQGRVYLD